MKTHVLARAAVGAAASLTVLLPLAACSADGNTGTRSPSPGSSAPTSSSSEPSTGSEPSSPAADASSGDYEDGTYTAKGYYGGAPSYMTFTVTLDDNRITDVSSELMPDNNATSRGYQEKFAAALPDEVVGKSVDEVEVGKLAGSSSCGDGFNDAMATIREQAR